MIGFSETFFQSIENHTMRLPSWLQKVRRDCSQHNNALRPERTVAMLHNMFLSMHRNVHNNLDDSVYYTLEASEYMPTENDSEISTHFGNTLMLRILE